jgi:DNA mismatch repair ATPase MutS
MPHSQSGGNGQAPQARQTAPVMFLLDEILQGTNSRERQIAVMKVVERLLAYGAVGAISTHDLELADQAEVQRISQIVHFRESFESIDGAERMRFDYLMRPGPTPTTNALKLLSLVGLDRDLE